MVWLRRLLVLLLELFGAVIAGVVVLSLLVLWRLTEGPLRLEAIEPYLISGLSELAAPYRVTFETPSLTWGRAVATVGIEATKVRILTPEGATLAVVPEVEVAFSIPALMLGRPAPSAIRLVGPQLHAYRRSEGDISFSLLEQNTEKSGGSSDFLARWFDALSRPPESSSLLGALRTIEINAARLTIDDYQYGVRWQAPRADVTLKRDRGGIRGNVQVDVAFGEFPTSLKGDLLYSISRGDVQARLRVDGFNPADVARRVPALAQLSRANVPFSGQLTLRWAQLLGIAQMGFDLSAGKGEVALIDGQPPLALAYGQLVGQIDRQKQTAEISNLYMDFSGPTLTAAARAARKNDDVEVTAEANVTGMKAAQLGRYWPPYLAPGAQEWVTSNITEGDVTKAVARLDLRLPLAQPSALDVVAVDGMLKIDKATVHYIDGLPPATDVAGTAHFGKDHFNIDVTQGRVGELRIPSAEIQLLGLGEDSERADITVTVNGTLRDQMLLVDHEPLRYMQRLKLRASEAAGKATTRARFVFPLFSDLPIEEVGIAVSSRIEQAVLPGLVAGQGLSEGTLDLRLDGGGMRVTGTGKLGPAPAQFDWTESFVDDVSPGSEIRFTGTMDEAARQAFKVSWPEVLQGTAGVEGTYIKERGQGAQLAAVLDFKQAQLALPWFAWTKPTGVAARGSVSAVIDHEAVKSVPAFTLDAGAAQVRGSVAFAAGSAWQKVTLDRLSAPGTTLTGSVARKGEHGLVLNFKGRAADIRGVYADAPAPDGAPQTPAVQAQQPLDITFDINRLVTGEGREISGAVGRVVRGPTGWTQLQLGGKLLGDISLQVQLLPNASGRMLDIQCRDAGALLSTLHLMENIKGGVLNVSGQGKGDGPVEAVIDLRNFTYLRPATLQKLALAADPAGGAALARDEGMTFSRMRSRFTYDGSSLALSDGRLAGDLIGLTMEGKLDLLASTIDLRGTLVPLYGVNSAVGGIPVLGWLLTGGKGGGIFAATYSVSGPLKDPQTSVNPLSILTPGILRNIFFLGGD